MDRIVSVAASHQEPLCREAAVAALGGLGSPGACGRARGARGQAGRPATRGRSVGCVRWRRRGGCAGASRAGQRLAGAADGRGPLSAGGHRPVSRSSERRRSVMSRSCTASKFSMHLPAPDHDALEGRVDQAHRQARLFGEAAVQALQHCATAHEVEALAQRGPATVRGGRRRGSAGQRPLSLPPAPRSPLGPLRERGSRSWATRSLGRGPRTSALTASSIGHAEPMAILISSAVRSPMAMPYSRRT